MKPWIATALQELEAEYKAAEAEARQADLELTLATSRRDDTMDRANSVYNLLRDFREYASAKVEGGAP